MTSLRKQARRKLKSYGFTGDQAGIAWYNQLDALRKNSDLRGKDLRQQAYNNIVGTNDTISIPTSIFKTQINLPKAAALPILGNRPAASTTIVKSVVKPTTFSQAFRDARSQGLKVFDWNGKSYTTELAKDKKNNPVIPEVEIDIPDSNIQIDDNFKPFGKTRIDFATPFYFRKTPEVGWPMPVPKIITKWDA